jgi:hypothetical protein
MSVIRNAAAWSGYAASSTCTGGPAASLSWSTQMLLVYSLNSCAEDGRSAIAFRSVCLYSDRMEVQVDTSYNSAIGAPVVLGRCQNIAAVVPSSTLPVWLTVCHSDYYMNTLLSTSCTSSVIP